MIRWTSSPLDRVFDDFFAGLPATRASFLPVDIHRTDSDLVVEASVPGFSPDEVDVSIDDDVLTISAHHDHEQPHGGKHREHQPTGECVRHERHWGSLYRQVYLGRGVNADAARAEFNDGVLRVTVPLQQKQAAHRIEVTAGSSAQNQGLT